MKNQKGFSLVELLVVVIIIAIVAAIAIPNLLASRRAANEASAISTLRTIHSAQAVYQATTGNSVSYADGSALTGLVDSVLAADTFTKSGYDFSVLADGANDSLYCGTAIADVQDSTGVRSFGVGIDGVVEFDPAGGIVCAAGEVTTGNPLP